MFGTVLFGRMQGGAGADRALGLFINTLPVRMRLGERRRARTSVRRTHAALARAAAARARVAGAGAALQRRGGAGAAVHARCSTTGTAAAAPSERRARRRRWEGIELLGGEERTNYPLTLSVDDSGEGFALTAQVRRAGRSGAGVRAACSTALERWSRRWRRRRRRRCATLDVLPAAERRRLLEEWNATDARVSARDACIHELFEAQAARTPDAVAVVYEERDADATPS